MSLIKANETYWKISPKQINSVSFFDELACLADKDLYANRVY